MQLYVPLRGLIDLEEERGRIARELHDELGQTLAAMRMDIAELRHGLGAGQADSDDLLDSIDRLAAGACEKSIR